MSTPRKFDIDITLSDAALGWPAFPIQSSPQPSSTSEGDEFDIDCKYLDLDPIGVQPEQSWTLAVSPGDEIMAVGSGFFGWTCSNTCAVVFDGGNTCSATCSNTCAVVFGGGNTCAATCSSTCGCGAFGTWFCDGDDDDDDDG